MDETREMLESLLGTTGSISIFDFIVNLILTAILGLILGVIYVRMGNSLSNRRMLTITLLLISITTMIIISVVQSSLALSLGLVGALSIIRFRTAVKEPEELAYFFIAIAVGLGMGANQRVITIIGFGGLALVIFLKSYRKQTGIVQNLIIGIATTGLDTSANVLSGVSAVVGKYCRKVELKRVDEVQDLIELAFFVEIKDLDELIKMRTEIHKTYGNVKINFLENR